MIKKIKNAMLTSRLLKILLLVIFLIVIAIVIRQIHGNILSTWGLLL
ncbi:MAG: hypothetical protein ACMXX9_01915 [Candidatus Woesearchaeota archaeon]